MSDIRTATKRFETWLEGQLDASGGLDPGALELKRTKMSASAFDFLRGTFYRWAERWLAEGASGVAIASVGDLHVENFGGWEDAQGVQVWGINDFDEACLLPWTSDLTRLGVSAVIGLASSPMKDVTESAALAAILQGYATGLGVGTSNGKAVPWNPANFPAALVALAAKTTPAEFWEKQDKKLVPAEDMPASAPTALAKLLGDGAQEVKHQQRKPNDLKGTGSLGKRRYFALGKVNNERVMVEAKAFAPSALELLRPGNAGPGLQDMVNALGSLAEPEYQLDMPWVVRRLSPEMVKSAVDDLAKLRNKGKITVAEVTELLSGMGAALAGIHSLDPAAATVATELASNLTDPAWYAGLVEAWRLRTLADFEEFTK